MKLEINKKYENGHREVVFLTRFLEGWFYGTIITGLHKGMSVTYRDNGMWSNYESLNDLKKEVIESLPFAFSIATPNNRIHQIVQQRFFDQKVFWLSGWKEIINNKTASCITYTNGAIHSNFEVKGEVVSLTDFLSKDIYSNIRIGSVEISREDAARIVEKSKNFNKYCLPDKFYVKTPDRDLHFAVRGQITRLLPVTSVQGAESEAVRYCIGTVCSVTLESVANWPRVRLDTLFEPKVRLYDTILVGEHKGKVNKETITIGGATISIAELTSKLST